MSDVVAPQSVATAAAQARIKLLDAGLRGDGFTQAIELGEKLVMQEPLDRADQLNLRAVHARNPESVELQTAQDLLGGPVCRDWLFNAELPERPLKRLSDRLEALDERLAARILGALEAVFKAAVGKTAIKVASNLPGRRTGCPIEWVDAQPLALVKGAISAVEENAVLDTVSDLEDLLPPILVAAALDLALILSDELGIDSAPSALLIAPAQESAIQVATRSLANLILGRLARNDVETPVSVPPNIARDILHAAGGADVSAAGGIPKSQTGRVLVAGVETTGDGFATSQTVVDTIQAEADPGQQVESVRRWKHSGSSDPIPQHKRNNGRRDVDCDLSAGTPGGPRNCGCSWVTSLEVVAA